MVVVHVVQNTSTSAGKDTADAGAAGIAPIVQTPIVFWILEARLVAVGRKTTVRVSPRFGDTEVNTVLISPSLYSLLDV